MIAQLLALFSVSGNFIGFMQVFSSTSAPVASAFKKECRSYEALPDAPGDVDQLRWWQHHQEQFPLLSYLARVVFAVPAASSKSERVFSVAGNMVTPKRNSLAPKQVICKAKIISMMVITDISFSLMNLHNSSNFYFISICKGGKSCHCQV